MDLVATQLSEFGFQEWMINQCIQVDFLPILPCYICTMRSNPD